MLLARFGARYAEAKAQRAGLDFEDLELGVRDLLAADPEDRQRWAERFALIMVDEFQDTNRLQLDVLEALERDNLFAVGDEFQSIYGFRHADVTIFRERRAALGEDRVRPLTANFRSREELLDVLNAAYAPQWPERFAPLLAGNGKAPDDGGELRLFDPGDPGGAVPSVELLVTDSRGWDEDTRLGLAGVETKPHRRAEARALAHRLREEVDAGRPARDIVVLVRATASLRVLEEALEEQGVTTYVVGGRGYWSQQPVRDGIAYLAALANPLDEEALLGVLASPFCGVGSDALILLADAGRASGGGIWAALRARRARSAGLPPEDGGAAAGVRDVLRRRAGARGAAAGRGAARARARGDGLRPRGARAGERRAAAREPPQADAPGARVRAGGGARPARLPRLRRDARLRRGARGRGAARVRGARRGAADDDPPREGARVPGRLRRRPRPPGRGPARPPADRPRGRDRAAPRHARRRRDGARARLRAARRRGRDRGGRGGAAAVLRRDDARPRPPDPVRQHEPRAPGRAAPGRPAARLDRARAAGRRARSGAARAGRDRRLGRAADARVDAAHHPGHDRARRAARPSPAGGSARPAPRCPRAPRSCPRPPPRGRRPSGSRTPPSASTRAAPTASTSSARCACPTCARPTW